MLLLSKASDLTSRFCNDHKSNTPLMMALLRLHENELLKLVMLSPTHHGWAYPYPLDRIWNYYSMPAKACYASISHFAMWITEDRKKQNPSIKTSRKPMFAIYEKFKEVSIDNCGQLQNIAIGPWTINLGNHLKE